MNKYVLTLFSLLIFGEVLSQITKTQVGLTRYDLQTNNSIERRVVVDPSSGKVVVVYTGSIDPDNGTGSFSNRGTGYYFYSGSGTITPQTSFPGRIENARTGWPSPIFLSGGGEAIVAHEAGSTGSGLFFSKRTSAGTGSWAYSDLSSNNETWPRMANSGDSIFIITSVSSASTPTALPNGMYGGIAMKRSYDGGATWVPSGAGIDTIPGINLSIYPNVGTNQNVIGGDAYSLDVKGSKVAILTGSRDVTLFTSNDFGNTWTKKTLIDGDNNTTDTLIRTNRSSGDYSVLIDNAGKVHCFWGKSYSNGYNYTLFEAGIVYWNEYMGSAAPKVINKTIYGKESNVNALPYFPFYTAVQFNGTASNDAQTSYGSTHTSQPSSGIDAAGNIYLSYMRLRGINDTNRYKNLDLFDAQGAFMNDCYLLKSTDNGATWIGPINVSNSDSMESAFPSIARHVDNYVHMVYQEDTLYGYAVGSTNLSHSGNTDDNQLIYARVPVADIVNETDITSPILRLSDSFTQKSKLDSFSGSDTFTFYNGCNRESRSNLIYTDALSFIKNFCYAFDNNDEGNVLYIDTPLGLKMNVQGVYPLKVYAKDAAGNVSDFRFTAGASRDTIKFFVKVVVTDVTPPTLTITKKLDYVYLGTPYTLPSGNATAKDDNPCVNATVTSPNASQVDVNTIGLYNLVYIAKDGANNTTTDTLRVYVGVAPTAVITEESLSGTTLKGKGTTSLNLLTNGEANNFKWTVKKGNSTLSNSLGSSASTNTLNTTLSNFPAFDSLCLQVTNLFNSLPTPPKSPSVTCKYLKFGSSISSSNNQVEVTIFPNPNQGNFNIAVSGNKSNKAVVSITALDGRKLAENQVEIKNGLIPMSLNLSSGTYFLSTEIDGAVKLDKIEIK